MKPLDEIKRELTRQWLKKAEDDWRLGHRLMPDPEPHLEGIAFHAQQAVEKYIKAFLTWHQVEFPKTHDIKRLLALMSTNDPALAEDLREATRLTPYGVEYRYPGDYPPVTKEAAGEAVSIADRVRDRLRDYLRDKLDA